MCLRGEPDLLLLPSASADTAVAPDTQTNSSYSWAICFKSPLIWIEMCGFRDDEMPDDSDGMLSIFDFVPQSSVHYQPASSLGLSDNSEKMPTKALEQSRAFFVSISRILVFRDAWDP